jgi:hypothetical protein
VAIFRPTLERREQLTLEAFLEAAHARPPQRDRPVAQAQPSRLAEAVAVARDGVDRVAPRVAGSAEDPVHFFLQHALQELLHALPRERLQGLPGRA